MDVRQADRERLRKLAQRVIEAQQACDAGGATISETARLRAVEAAASATFRAEVSAQAVLALLDDYDRLECKLVDPKTARDIMLAPGQP